MRLRRAHWVRLDYAVAAVCAALVFGVLFKSTGPYRLPVTAWSARDWLPPLLAVGVSIPVAFRRRAPVTSFVWVLVACTAVLGLGGEITRGPFLALMMALYLLAATRRHTVSALAASLVLLGVQALTMHLSGKGSGNAVVVSLVLVISWMVGYAVRQRRAYTAHLRERVAEVAVTAERLRIARELHDVVAHSMTVVAVQAGFGEYVFDRQPADARAALGAIQTVTREALADMQRLLGVLRQGDRGGEQPGGHSVAGAQGGAGPQAGAEPATGGTPAAMGAGAGTPLAPAPGLADLDRLVTSTAGAGVRVEVEQTGQARAIPPGIDLSAFRIVQEALTNVVKHSGADNCRVSITYGNHDLYIEITDRGPPAGTAVMARAGTPAAGVSAPATGTARTLLAPRTGTGHGIAGMRERVSLCGGELAAAPLPGRGFEVAARFPLAGVAS